MGPILTLWEQVTVKDVLDMSIVAILLYQFLLIVHGTRAVQVLFGVAVLGLLFWLGISYEFWALNWVLAHFFDSFFIIVVILFQDQIRTALASLGTRGPLLGRQGRPKEDPVEEIAAACGALARERIGALVVLERAQGLSNYSDTGTNFDGRLHSDVLYAIFQSRSSLHDGAAIISRGRLVAAGCFLPLSKNVEVERHMGTRHRAAMGITEVTDAVAVVVSEESGAISVCVGGDIRVCGDDRELARALRALMGGERREVRSFLWRGTGGSS